MTEEKADKPTNPCAPDLMLQPEAALIGMGLSQWQRTVLLADTWY